MPFVHIELCPARGFPVIELFRQGCGRGMPRPYPAVTRLCVFLLTAGYYFSYQLGSSDTSEIQPSHVVKISRQSVSDLRSSFAISIPLAPFI